MIEYIFALVAVPLVLQKQYCLVHLHFNLCELCYISGKKVKNVMNVSLDYYQRSLNNQVV